MLDLIDFSCWNVYDGASEGSGRSEKIWLKSENGSMGLFKFPKINPSDNKETTEHISEHLAYKIGKVLGIPTAKVDLGVYNGRIGCMSHFVCEEKEILSEGIWFISSKFPQYDADKMINMADGKYYCLNHLLEAVPNILSNTMWMKMILFDFIIGNSDRHQSNWAILIKREKEHSLRLRWCPLYDNGSSLCCYINEEECEKFLGNDKTRFESLVDSKSRSLIRIDGTKKSLPTHREVVSFLLNNYAASKEIAKDIILKLSSIKIEEFLVEYPDDILYVNKKRLINKFLNRKCEILNELLKEVESGEEKK